MSSRPLTVGFILIALLAGGATFYYQQQTSSLTSQVNALTNNLGSSNSQVSGLKSQTSDLQTKNDQLSTKISQLQNMVEEMNSTHRVLPLRAAPIFSGVLYLLGTSPGIVPVPVPADSKSAELNFTASGSTFYVQLMSASQYSQFQPWTNSPTTWQSSLLTSITTQVIAPDSGDWYLVFQNQPGSGSENRVSVSVTLVTVPSTTLSQQSVLISKGQISLVDNNQFQYVNFTVPPFTESASLNLTFTTGSTGCIGSLSQYTPCALGVSLLTPQQFIEFRNCNCIEYGNYTLVTWSSPLATTYTTQLTIPRGGAWIIVFYPEPGAMPVDFIQVNETALMVPTLKG